jgi:hypothetical protein
MTCVHICECANNNNNNNNAMWSLKPERWGSPLVQEKYQEEKACDKRHPYRIITIPKIHFTHLGIKEIYCCSFRAIYIICALFSTKCHLFQKFTFFVRLILTVSKISTLSFKVSILLCLFYPPFPPFPPPPHTHTHCMCHSSYLILLHLITITFDIGYKLQNSFLQSLGSAYFL